MSIKVLYPDGVDLDPGDAAVALVGAASKDLAVADLQGLPDDDAGYLEFNSSGGDVSITLSLDNMPDMVVANSVSLNSRMRNPGAFTVDHQPFLWIGGVRYDGTLRTLGAGSGYTDFADVFATNPATGLAWSRADLDALKIGDEQKLNATEEGRLTQLNVSVDYVAGAALSPAALEVASRILRLFRRDMWLPEIAGPLLWADVEILQDMGLSMLHYPDSQGGGAGSEVWQRALLRALSCSIDLDRLTCARKSLDLRGYLCSFWDTGSSEAAAGASAPSSARLDVGARRSYVRASKSWVQNAAAAAQGSAQLIEVGADVEKAELLGNLIEPGRTNKILHSAFSAGAFTDWTVTGNVVADTDDLLFANTVSTQSAQFARAGAADCRLAQAPAAYAGSEVLTLSTWHKDDSGFALSWSLQRSTDSFWWNDATEAWQVGFVANAHTVRAARDRDVSKPIVLSAAAQTLTLIYYAEAVSDQVNHAYHSQLEEGRYATSPIFTTTAAVTREADVLRVENDGPNGHVWMGEQGTARCTWVPEMDTDASIVDDSVLLNSTAVGDGESFDTVYYRPSTGLMCFERDRGTPFVATVPVTLVRGQVVEVVARASGFALEYGMAENTLSIFVKNGSGPWVKGTDAVATGTAVHGDWLDIGCAERLGVIGSQAGGNLSNIQVIPQVLADEEIPDWL